MAGEKILVVEDEALMRTILRKLFEQQDYEVFTADSAEHALDIFRASPVDLTISDIKMAGRDGISFLRDIKALDPNALIVMITAYTSVDTAVEALRNGAYDYVAKPFVNEYLLRTVRNALERQHLASENRYLRRELRHRYDQGGFIGTSAAAQAVFEIVKKVAATSANVLIQGESGSGKELVARSIHLNSARSELPYLAINCGAIPAELLESELFGHRRGAFTGAVSDSLGLFRAAGGGTLLLDEIAEMPLQLQVKVLRAIQEHEVTPVGTATPLPFGARLIAATNKDLRREVDAGRFREDLFYRLNVVEIVAPPLRDRRDDLPLLVRYILGNIAEAEGSGDKAISAEAMTAIERYAWPGNVRELGHAIERAYILSGPTEIQLDDLPESLRGSDSQDVPPSERLAEVERHHILRVMQRVGDDKPAAADILDIDLSTLYRKLKRYS